MLDFPDGSANRVIRDLCKRGHERLSLHRAGGFVTQSLRVSLCLTTFGSTLSTQTEAGYPDFKDLTGSTTLVDSSNTGSEDVPWLWHAVRLPLSTAVWLDDTR